MNRILRALLPLLALSLAVSASAQKVTADFDEGSDFTKFKTYLWVKGTPAANTAMESYIVSVTDEAFRRQGLTRVEKVADADMALVYHVAVDTTFALSGYNDPTFAATWGRGDSGHQHLVQRLRHTASDSAGAEGRADSGVV